MIRGFAFALCLAVSGCQCTDDEAPLRTAEVHGLQAAITLLQRTPSPAVSVGYRLEWKEGIRTSIDSDFNVTMENVWLLGPDEPAVVSIRDGSGAIITKHIHPIELPASFRQRSVTTLDVRFEVPLPPRAESISVALAGSGLETPPAPLPQ